MILGIYGTGGTGTEVYDMLQMMEHDWQQIVFIDDTKECGEFRGCPNMPFERFQERYKTDEARVVIAIGEPSGREALYKKVKGAGYTLATIVHPSSVILPSVSLGEGCVVKFGALISSDAKLENNVYVQSRAIIGHGVVIHKNSILSSLSYVAGNSEIGEKVFVGIQSCVREKTVVGNNAVIAMGAVVMRDVPENATVMGNPARIVTVDDRHSVFGKTRQHIHGGVTRLKSLLARLKAPRKADTGRAPEEMHGGQNKTVGKQCLGVYGAGSLSRELYEIVKEENDRAHRWNDVVFIDDTMEEGEYLGKKRYPFQKICQLYTPQELELIIAVGEPSGKEKVYQKVKEKGFSLTNIIDPSAHISPDAVLGEGIVVKYNVLIMPGAQIGNNVYIQSNVIIGHNVCIGDNVEISAGVTIAGFSKVGDDTYLGVGALIKQEVLVGRDAIVSMGAVVLKDVPDNVIVMGNPARILKENVHKQALKRRFE